jgi:tetratricopeptide (TPR) repeat protein
MSTPEPSRPVRDRNPESDRKADSAEHSRVLLLRRLRDGGISVRQTIANIVPRAGRLFLLLLLLLIVYRSLSDRAILIEPFDVPSELEVKGYSGRVLASALLDRVHDFRRSVQSNAQQSEFRSTWSAVEADFDIEAAGFSSKKLTQLFRYILGVAPTRLTGEIVQSPGGIRLTVRANNKSHSIPGQLEELDSIIERMAHHVVRVSEPYFFGLYIVDDNPKLALDVVQELLRGDDSRWHPWAYNLWGIVLDKNAKHKEAQAKFKQALNISGWKDRDAKIAALINLGVSLKQTGSLPDAENHFRKAVLLKPDYVFARLKLANLLKEQKRYEEALDQYREAIDAAPSRAELYYGRAEVRSQLRDFRSAINDLKFAIELEPKNTDGLFDLGLNSCLDKVCTDALEYVERYVKQAPAGRFADKARYLSLQCPSNCLELRK